MPVPGNPQPNRPKPPRRGTEPPRKPLQVLHISRKVEPSDEDLKKADSPSALDQAGRKTPKQFDSSSKDNSNEKDFLF